MSKRAEELCSGVHVLHDEALELAETVLFMAKKLEESRRNMEGEPLVIEYDNGGGQCGIRENPNYVAFERLAASYNKALRLLTEIVEKGAPVRGTSDVMKELAVITGKKVG